MSFLEGAGVPRRLVAGPVLARWRDYSGTTPAPTRAVPFSRRKYTPRSHRDDAGRGRQPLRGDPGCRFARHGLPQCLRPRVRAGDLLPSLVWHRLPHTLWNHCPSRLCRHRGPRVMRVDITGAVHPYGDSCARALTVGISVNPRLRGRLRSAGVPQAAQALGEVAGRVVPRPHLAQQRLLDLAALLRVLAARVEIAAGGRIHRVGDLAPGWIRALRSRMRGSGTGTADISTSV